MIRRNFSEIATENLVNNSNDDPSLVIIANTEPKEFDQAVGLVIDRHNGLLQRSASVDSILDNVWSEADMTGEEIRSSYEKLHKEMDETGLILKSFYGEESTGFDSAIEQAKSMSMTPPSILGMHAGSTFTLEMYGKESDMLNEQIRDSQNEYDLAVMTKNKRDQLARPAKLLTWIASTAMLVGIGFGIARADIHKDTKNQDTPVASEIAQKAGAIVLLDSIAAVPIFVAGDKMGKKSARRRAQHKLNKA
jgi:hypothetical protein